MSEIIREDEPSPKRMRCTGNESESSDSSVYKTIQASGLDSDETGPILVSGTNVLDSVPSSSSTGSDRFTNLKNLSECSKKRKIVRRKLYSPEENFSKLNLEQLSSINSPASISESVDEGYNEEFQLILEMIKEMSGKQEVLLHKLNEIELARSALEANGYDLIFQLVSDISKKVQELEEDVGKANGDRQQD